MFNLGDFCSVRVCIKGLVCRGLSLVAESELSEVAGVIVLHSTLRSEHRRSPACRALVERLSTVATDGLFDVHTSTVLLMSAAMKLGTIESGRR
jgi:hypothetical protein